MTITYWMKKRNGKKVKIPTPLISQILRQTNLNDRIVKIHEICPDTYKEWDKLGEETSKIKEENWTGNAEKHTAFFLKDDVKEEVVPSEIINYITSLDEGKICFEIELNEKAKEDKTEEK